MKISLGQHKIPTGNVVEAWIEPNRPAYRNGAVRDHGFLCIEERNPDQTDPKPINLRLENLVEDGWKLRDAVGTELMRQLWDERSKYDQRPFYMAHDHPLYGRVYFDPWKVIGSEPSVAFHTRPDGRYPQEGAVIPEYQAAEQLQFLYAHQRMYALGGLIPDTNQIAAAIDHGKRMADLVVAARADYGALVDWDFDYRLTTPMMITTSRIRLTDPDDMERYEQLSFWAHRPGSSDFDSESEKFYRWYEYGGKVRLDPLTREQLTDYLRDERGYSQQDAVSGAQMNSVPAADWEWFKDKLLGRMREPVEVLHQLIRHEEQQTTPNREWLNKATKAGDFCADVYVEPAKVHAVVQEYVAEGQRGYVLAQNRMNREAAERELKILDDDSLYLKAVAALKLMENPKSGLIIEQQIEPQPDEQMLILSDDLDPAP